MRSLEGLTADLKRQRAALDTAIAALEALTEKPAPKAPSVRPPARRHRLSSLLLTREVKAQMVVRIIRGRKVGVSLAHLASQFHRENGVAPKTVISGWLRWKRELEIGPLDIERMPAPIDVPSNGAPS